MKADRSCGSCRIKGGGAQMKMEFDMSDSLGGETIQIPAYLEMLPNWVRNMNVQLYETDE